MENDKRYGEIKTGKNIFPGTARKIIEKGTIDIVISCNPLSKKTKEILLEGKITVYENVDKETQEKIKEKLTENKEKE